MTTDRDPVRILVADDQAIVRDGLTMLLGLLPGIEVVGVAIDGDDAVRQVERLDPDVVLMDLEMPRCNGVEAIKRLDTLKARSRVIVLTTYSDDASVFAALRAGARGYLTKDADSATIREAIDAVMRGDAQLDTSVQRRLLEALAAAPEPEAVRPAPLAPPDGITEREREVLVLIADGLANREIADALVISEPTVKTHINRLLAKTRCRSRAELVRYAYRHRLATP